MSNNNVFKSFDNENIENTINNNKVNSAKNNEEFEKFKEMYKDKSETEILNEAKAYSDRLKNQLGEEEYNKKLQELKKFEMFLTKDQKNKLNEFLNKIK